MSISLHYKEEGESLKAQVKLPKQWSSYHFGLEKNAFFFWGNLPWRVVLNFQLGECTVFAFLPGSEVANMGHSRSQFFLF